MELARDLLADLEGVRVIERCLLALENIQFGSDRTSHFTVVPLLQTLNQLVELRFRALLSTRFALLFQVIHQDFLSHLLEVCLPLYM